MKTPRLAVLLGALILIATSIVAIARRGEADSQLTVEGVRCDDTNFRVDEVGPSVFSANAFRLTQLVTMEQRVTTFLNCGPQAKACWEIPGYEPTMNWWKRDHYLPWPSSQDPKYIYQRTLRLQEEGSADGESRRAEAHLACMLRYGAGPSPRSQDTVDNELRDLTACPALVASELKEDAELSDAFTNHDGGAGPDASKKEDLAKEFYACLNLRMGGSGREYCNVPAMWDHQRPWKRVTSGILEAARQVVPLRAPIPASIQGLPLHINPSEEAAAILKYFSACPQADVYLSPTHDIVRHTIDQPIGEHFSVCADTASFAVDQPIELILSTPAAQQVEWLWPGEPKDIHLHPSMLGRTQIAHLEIGGYPRRELLRALARNPTGPLETTDIFDQTAQAALQQSSAQKAEAAASVMKELKDYATKLANNLSFDSALQCLDTVLKGFKGRAFKADFSCVQPATKQRFCDSYRDNKDNDDLYCKEVRDRSEHDGGKAEAGKSNADSTDLDATHAEGDLQAQSVAVLEFLTGKGNPPTAGAKALSSTAQKQLNLPEPTKIAYATPAQVLKLATYVDGLVDSVNPTGQDSTTTNSVAASTLTIIADQLCSLTSEVVPLVSEDILIRGPQVGPDPYVLVYDFAGGFQLATPGELDEGRPVFFIIRNVAPGWSVSVDAGKGTVVQRDLTLVGLTSTVDPGGLVRTTEARDGFGAIQPFRREVQPPSTHILSIGMSNGDSRRDVTVCASRGGATCTNGDVVAPATSPASSGDDNKSAKDAVDGGASGSDAGASGGGDAKKGGAASSAPSAHVIARNSIVIHRRHFLGVRAGFGASVSSGGFQDLVLDANTNRQVIRYRSNDTEASVPLLVTWYPHGRDTTTGPARFGWSSLGVAGGLDALQAFTSTPRLFLGGVFDVYGLGFTVAASLERTNYVDGVSGTSYSPGTLLQTDYVWRAGAFFGVTMDADLFEAVFKSYFSQAPFPSVETPAP